MLKFSQIIDEGFKEVKKKFLDLGADEKEIDIFLAKFKNLSTQNKLKPDEKNIDVWGKKNFLEFKKFVSDKEVEITKTQIKTKKVEGNKIELARNKSSIAYIPLDKLASCNIGRKTDWCTTKVNQRYFEEYIRDGVTLVYVITNDEDRDPVAAMAIKPSQYDDNFNVDLFDPQDNSLDEFGFLELTTFSVDKLKNLALAPQIQQKLEPIRQEFIGPKIAYQKAEEEYLNFGYIQWMNNKNRKNLEKIIAKDPELSFNYAWNILNKKGEILPRKRFLEGEKTIATDSDHSLEYAQHIIQGRFPEGEKAIARFAQNAYAYSTEVLNDERFPEGEEQIKKSDMYAVWYAIDVLKKRWDDPEVESRILRSNYAKGYTERFFGEKQEQYVPDRYLSGLDKATKEKRKKFWNKLGEYPFTKKEYSMSQVNTPGDETRSDKESKYTKKFKEIYEDLDLALENKSKKSGIPVDILRKVYNRGMAAWVTGHRPGANQQQWAMARVNSFITKGKTYKTADKDLADML